MTDPVRCSPGEFNPFSQQTQCTQCPEGTVCPPVPLLEKTGLISSEPCPRGFICDSKALPFASKRCTPGHFCLSGVSALNQSMCGRLSSSSSCILPKLCPAGVYCLAGVVDNVTRFSGIYQQQKSTMECPTQPCIKESEWIVKSHLSSQQVSITIPMSCRGHVHFILGWPSGLSVTVLARDVL